MSRKHFEKIMSKRKKLIDKTTDLLEQQALDDQPKYLYMDPNGNIDWTRLAKHISEATSGR